jgi:hypothetical protein
VAGASDETINAAGAPRDAPSAWPVQDGRPTPRRTTPCGAPDPATPRDQGCPSLAPAACGTSRARPVGAGAPLHGLGSPARPAADWPPAPAQCPHAGRRPANVALTAASSCYNFSYAVLGRSVGWGGAHLQASGAGPTSGFGPCPHGLRPFHTGAPSVQPSERVLRPLRKLKVRKIPGFFRPPV